MIQLIADPRRMSRRTTRAEWYAVHRWLRQASRMVDRVMTENEKALRSAAFDLVAFGHCGMMQHADGRISYVPINGPSSPTARVTS